ETEDGEDRLRAAVADLFQDRVTRRGRLAVRQKVRRFDRSESAHQRIPFPVPGVEPPGLIAPAAAPVAAGLAAPGGVLPVPPPAGRAAPGAVPPGLAAPGAVPPPRAPAPAAPVPGLLAPGRAAAGRTLAGAAAFAAACCARAVKTSSALAAATRTRSLFRN